MTYYELLNHTTFMAIVFSFGLIVGSFLNVCISRWPAEQSVIKPRSRCPDCKNLIAWYDNIPVLSWLSLKAKCRHCSLKIPFIYPGVEILTGLCFVLVWKILLWTLPRYNATLIYDHQSMTLMLAVALLLTACGLVVIFVDFKHREIPDEISLNLMPLGPALCFFFPSIMMQGLYIRMHQIKTMPEIYCSDWLSAVLYSLSGIVVGGGGLWLLSIFGEKLLKKPAMGFGDVKLLAMLGGFLGPEGVILTLVLASFFGAIYGIISWIITRDRALPFGPWIMLAAMMIYLLKYDILKFSLDAMKSFLKQG